ncbi:putative AMP binding protein [Hyphomonas neptunium ATCC 15444]|uniref:Putative AMP binding protein n=1 Tax=Hyphomonas neptunium (strain ATCC 15444) TaxID=228405 RepID=Q0C1U0_HYPNA|nr:MULTISPECIES: fatty acyl-AMP ligase [Hyphomonas]ABI76156.1 putative AMP binding protein [Hyphomonas neptunium ATCC 15444]
MSAYVDVQGSFELKPTATEAGIPARLGTFQSACDALDYAAEGQSGINFYSSEGKLTCSLSYRELKDQALGVAARMAARFPRGARIGVIAETSPEFVITFMACQYSGLVPAPLSLPAAFGGRQTYEWQVSSMVRTAGLSAIFAPPALHEILSSATAGQDIELFDLSGATLPDETVGPVPHGAGDLSYIQFSSGSTSEPKGIVATQASLSANCKAIIQEGLQVRAGDRAVSWLPLYHDMGLVGFFIAPMYSQLSIDFLSPTDFARRPGTWLKLISANKGTLSYSPSFGYELCVRRFRGEPLDLSSWRAAGIGGDMVRADALDQFSETFAASGFRKEAFVASYGLAESTLAVSFAPLNTGLNIDRVDVARMQASERAVPASDLTREGADRAFVSCGKPLESTELKIVDPEGSELGLRQVGRIFIRSASLASGYFRADQELQPLTDKDGWLDTGDLGYWLADEIVVTGRSKDMILSNGRNIWPQDIEWVAQKIGGRTVARSAAFEMRDTADTSRIVLLVECRAQEAELRETLARDIAAAARSMAGAPVSVELVSIKSLPVTSSGKLSRAASRTAYISGLMHQAVGDSATRAAALP